MVILLIALPGAPPDVAARNGPSTTQVPVVVEELHPSECLVDRLPVEGTLDLIEELLADGLPPEVPYAEPVVQGRDVIDPVVLIDGAAWAAYDGLTGIQPPPGRPVDAEALAAVSRTIREDGACENANDMGRYLALRSPSGLRWLLEGFTRDGYDRAAWRELLSGPTDIGLGGDPRIAPVIVDARFVAHDHVVAFVLTSSDGVRNAASVSLLPPYLYVMSNVEGRWLIDDDLRAFLPIPALTDVTATPRASPTS